MSDLTQLSVEYYKQSTFEFAVGPHMIYACTITAHQMPQHMHHYLKHLCRCLLLEWTHLKLSPGRWLSPSPTLKVTYYAALFATVNFFKERRNFINNTNTGL